MDESTEPQTPEEDVALHALAAKHWRRRREEAMDRQWTLQKVRWRAQDRAWDEQWAERREQPRAGEAR